MSRTVANGTGTLSATQAMTYDALGNLLTLDGPLSGNADTIRYRYNGARQMVGAIGPDPDGAGALKHRAERISYTNGLATRTEAGTVNSQSDGDWAAFASLQEIQQDYDTNARPVVQRLASGGTAYALTQTSYDALGRVQCTAQRMNSAEFASLPSDACTLDTQGSFGPDRIERTTYDNAGQVTKVETGYAVSGVAADEVIATYRANGQAETVTDANGNKTTYVYDGHDRLSRTYMPHPSTAGTSSSTDYEELTYLTATVGGSTVSTPFISGRRLRDGYAFAFAYDALGRLVERDPPELPNVSTDATTVYAYDNLGRLISAAQPSIPHSLTFAWDALGRNVSETGVFGTIAYQYDLAGRRTRLSWPGSALYVDYDRLVTGEVSAIRENGATSGAGLLGTYAYDDLGRRTGLTRGNGATTSWSYDNVSRLTGLSHNLAGTASDVAFAYAYDPAGGIVSTTRDNDAYAYTGLANANVASTVNGLNQVTAAAGGTLYYDGRGNVIGVPAAASATGAAAGYDYMAENRLVHGPDGAAFFHDPLGRLFASYSPALGGTYYLTAGETIVAELDSGSAVTRRYVPGPGMDEPLVWYEGSGTSTRRWHHADERGSVIAVSDGSGALVGGAPNRYDEYGNAQGTLTGRFGYTGQPWLPEAGLYHYRARDYNPTMGRFMQIDPIGHSGGMNLYAYVGNNPVNFTDPLGLQDSGQDITVTACPMGSRATSNGGCTQHNRDRITINDYIRGFIDMAGEITGEMGQTIVVTGRKTQKLSQCQQTFISYELSRRGLPVSHLPQVTFVSGLDSNAGEITRAAYYSNPRPNAVTQGNTIYVRPQAFNAMINLSGYVPFEEIIHTAQFAEAGSPARFYYEYGVSSGVGAVFGGNSYDGNVFEVFAKAAGRQMAQASASRMCR